MKESIQFSTGLIFTFESDYDNIIYPQAPNGVIIVKEGIINYNYIRREVKNFQYKPSDILINWNEKVIV